MSETVQWALLVLCAVMGLALAQDPKVTIRDTEPPTMIEIGTDRTIVNAKRDQDVTLSCFVEDLNPELSVRWRNLRYFGTPREEEVFISTDMAITDTIKYSIEKPTDYTWRLRVKDIQVWDEGMFECFVQLTGLSVARDIRYVNVLVIPYLTPSMTSPDTTVTAGEDLTLMCNATGRPTPTIQWSRLGGELLPVGKEHHLGPLLPISTVKARDRGQYKCDVWNSIGALRRDILLDVRFAPMLVIEEDVVYQKSGYSAELQCLVEANPTPSESQMKFVKDGLSYTVTTGKYIIRTIEGAFDRLMFEMIIDGVQDEDYGTYSCIISNSMSLSGPAQKSIRLAKSDTAQPSKKVGRLMAAGEWRKRFASKLVQDGGGASGLMVSIATIITCLLTVLCHH